MNEKLTEKLRTLENACFDHDSKFGAAARLALDAGLPKLAISEYERAGVFGAAARVAAATGDHEYARRLYEKAIDSFVAVGWFDCAAKLAEEIGMDNYAAMYKNINDLTRAILDE